MHKKSFFLLIFDDSNSVKFDFQSRHQFILVRYRYLITFKKIIYVIRSASAVAGGTHRLFRSICIAESEPFFTEFSTFQKVSNPDTVVFFIF